MVITIAHLANCFWEELIKNTSPCKNFLKHGETLFDCKMIDGNTLKIIQIISFNPFEANRTLKFLANLADYYKTTIIGRAQPNAVGPSVTNSNKFFFGMNKEKLLKWYKIYGCEITEKDGNFYIKRSPK
jgi:hypothetical protein